jgi:hypothetical protein
LVESLSKGGGLDKRKEGAITLYYGVCVTSVSSDSRKSNHTWHFVDPVPVQTKSSPHSLLERAQSSFNALAPHQQLSFSWKARDPL